MVLVSSPPRAWQRMLSGRRLDILNPSPLDIEIEDIAHGLSRVARWNGQTTGDWAYSVAQHSVVVEEIARSIAPKSSRTLLLAALLHDASEYVIGDLITPFKSAIGLNYKAVEHRLEAAVHMRFGIPTVLPLKDQALIKRADRAAAYWEAVEIAGFREEETRRIFKKPAKIGPLSIKIAPPERAKASFLQRFEQLVEASK